MILSFLSFLMMIAHVALLAYTGFFLPIRARLQFPSYALYIVRVGGLWLIYTVLAMLLDAAMGADVPGGDYLFLGFVAWCVGSVVFAVRAFRNQIRTLPKFLAASGRSAIPSSALCVPLCNPTAVRLC